MKFNLKDKFAWYFMGGFFVVSYFGDKIPYGFVSNILSVVNYIPSLIYSMLKISYDAKITIALLCALEGFLVYKLLSRRIIFK